MTQITFEEHLARQPKFNGNDYDHARDRERLTGQIKRVYDVMKSGARLTLQDIADLTGDPHASISAQLRHLRKTRFGGFTINKEHLGNGLYRYWMETTQQEKN